MSHKKILIVEDERSVLEAYVKSLEKHYQLVTARNGEEGIAKLQTEGPDLVLVDLIMPIKHGHDFLIEKKHLEAVAAIPVFVMTNVESESERKVSLDDLLATIAKYLRV